MTPVQICNCPRLFGTPRSDVIAHHYRGLVHWETSDAHVEYPALRHLLRAKLRAEASDAPQADRVPQLRVPKPPTTRATQRYCVPLPYADPNSMV